MNALRRAIAKLPAPLAITLGFLFFVCIGFAAAWLAPPPRDLLQECQKRCHPLQASLVDDKTYPLSARTQSYPQVCKCGSAP
jgi:hypothetical protein